MFTLIILCSLISLFIIPLHLKQTFHLNFSPQINTGLLFSLTVIYWTLSLLRPLDWLLSLILFFHYLLAIGDMYYFLLSPVILKSLLVSVLFYQFPLDLGKILMIASSYCLFYFFQKKAPRPFIGLGDIKVLAIWFLFLNYWQLYFALLIATSSGLFFIFLNKKYLTCHIPFVPFLFVSLILVI